MHARGWLRHQTLMTHSLGNKMLMGCSLRQKTPVRCSLGQKMYVVGSLSSRTVLCDDNLNRVGRKRRYVL
jgi:hypothetical protein